jgi:hypothetical protein
MRLPGRFARAAYPPRDRLPPSQPITPATESSNVDRLRAGLIGCCSLKHPSDTLGGGARSHGHGVRELGSRISPGTSARVTISGLARRRSCPRA